MTDKINKICIFKFVTNTTCPLYILYWNVIAFPSNILFKPIGLTINCPPINESRKLKIAFECLFC